mmetsp:Transcript_6296/g.13624  ORF Transcript_6296/g.13624 Transcript_6296/m.13624 type:complete len:293 (-) Transcript_6296:425-1303(-)
MIFKRRVPMDTVSEGESDTDSSSEKESSSEVRRREYRQIHILKSFESAIQSEKAELKSRERKKAKTSNNNFTHGLSDEVSSSSVSALVRVPAIGAFSKEGEPLAMLSVDDDTDSGEEYSDSPGLNRNRLLKAHGIPYYDCHSYNSFEQPASQKKKVSFETGRTDVEKENKLSEETELKSLSNYIPPPKTDAECDLNSIPDPNASSVSPLSIFYRLQKKHTFFSREVIAEDERLTSSFFSCAPHIPIFAKDEINSISTTKIQNLKQELETFRNKHSIMISKGMENLYEFFQRN